MFAWLFSPTPHPPRPKRGRRSLKNLLGSLVPIDGDFGRARPAREGAPGTEPCAAGPAAWQQDDGSPPPKGATHPTLPTHARNAVEEWIPSAILYGPPR